MHTRSAQQVIRDGYKICNQIHMNRQEAAVYFHIPDDNQQIMYVKNNLEAILYTYGIASVSQILVWQS